MSVPDWPDFELTQAKGFDAGPGHRTWRASTNTGRPITPVFTVHLTVKAALDDLDVRTFARAELWDRYRRAHPNGCP